AGWRFLEEWQQSRFSNDRRASGSLASNNQCQSSPGKRSVRRQPLSLREKNPELWKDLPPDRRANTRSGQRRLSLTFSISLARHPERSAAESKDPAERSVVRRDSSTSLGMTFVRFAYAAIGLRYPKNSRFVIRWATSGGTICSHLLSPDCNFA